MNPHELRVLLAVVDERGFSRAAAVLHLTQSAVSQAVKRLEEEVGGPLLERARPPALTPIGERVYRHAVDVLAREDLVRRELGALARGGPGILELGASQAESSLRLPGLLAAFLAAHPGALLRLETLPSRELVLAVAGGRLELGLGPFARSMAGLVTVPLGAQDMVLYAGRRLPGLASARRRRTKPARWVLVTSHLDAKTARPGTARLREEFAAVWEVHSLELRMRLIADGLAVGYLPSEAVRGSRWAADLVAVDWLSFGRIRRQVGLFSSAGRELSPMARAFVDLARGRA